MTTLLRANPGFRRLWTSQTTSQLGDRITELSLPLIAATTLEATTSEVALLTALASAPNLFALLLGVWVDRSPKRRLMIATDLINAATLLTLPIAYALGTLTMTQLYALAVVTGTSSVAGGTATSAVFARLVPPEAYVEANSLLSAGRSATYVAGPAAGGALVQALTAPVAVLVDALSFLVSASLIARIRMEEPPPAKGDRQLREGVRFVLGEPVLKYGLACTTTVNFFTYLTGTGMIVLYADRELQLAPGVIGTAFGVGALGGLGGAFAAPVLARKFGSGKGVVIGSVLFPLPFALGAAAGGPPWVRAVILSTSLFLSFFGVMLFDVNLNSLQAVAVPDGMRARVAGAYSTVNYGVRPLGALAGGALASAVGLRTTLIVAAVGGALSVLWLLPSPIPRTREPHATPSHGGRRDTDDAVGLDARPTP
ncbi:MFS transporter [Streptomyces niveiscabiei]|uniref:MFS transporter n=1 Tax=Streptomyces niveiscabiei TaxID=164115 RepID=A0ABW9HLL5_9ACTN